MLLRLYPYVVRCISPERGKLPPIIVAPAGNDGWQHIFPRAIEFWKRRGIDVPLKTGFLSATLLQDEVGAKNVRKMGFEYPPIEAKVVGLKITKARHMDLIDNYSGKISSESKPND